MAEKPVHHQDRAAPPDLLKKTKLNIKENKIVADLSTQESEKKDS
jgi:hypothetical protein